jgi:hypothetical protein
MKRCPRCGETKPLEAFLPLRKSAGREGKPGVYCHPCWRSYQREYRQAHRAEQRAAKKKWEAEHPEEVRAAKRRRYHARLEHNRELQRLWRANHPAEYAARKLKDREKRRASGLDAYYKYGLTPEAREALVAAQDGCCPICQRDLAEVDQHVDHDHDSPDRRVRGILCSTCNRHLGWFEKRKRAVLAYLG